ncbi:hypothetical protein [Amycolatopsis sp. cmx-11-32]|uniref:hypothetical protein n=1 Tax=Amycolatopsis sp. cmx-11-32 TaxID=2785796 RepID=UPI0039E520FC
MTLMALDVSLVGVTVRTTPGIAAEKPPTPSTENGRRTSPAMQDDLRPETSAARSAGLSPGIMRASSAPAWSVHGGCGRAICDIGSPVELVSKSETLGGC